MAKDSLEVFETSESFLRQTLNALNRDKPEPELMTDYPAVVDIQASPEAMKYMNDRLIPESLWCHTMYCPSPRMPENILSGTSVMGRRIILPFILPSGKLGYSGRAIDNNNTPKYYRPVSHVNHCVYNPANVGPGDTNDIWVVEGEFDVLACLREGIPAVSTFSANMSEHQAGFLSMFKRVIFLYDPDTAGRDGVKKALSKYHEYLKNYKVLWLPPELDPGKMPLGFGGTLRQYVNI
jgi:hypothetical protein